MLSDCSRNTSCFTEDNDSSQGSNASRNDDMEIQEASSNATSSVKNDSKTTQKKNKTFAPDSSKSPKGKYNKLTDPAISTSKVMHPALKPTLKPRL